MGPHFPVSLDITTISDDRTATGNHELTILWYLVRFFFI